MTKKKQEVQICITGMRIQKFYAGAKATFEVSLSGNTEQMVRVYKKLTTKCKIKPEITETEFFTIIP